MEQSITLQNQIRNNASDLHSFMTDMREWEKEMALKEAELNGLPLTEDYPPIRGESKKGKSKVTLDDKKNDKRITSTDYSAWEAFDADKACDNVDDEEIILPKDSKESEKDKKLSLLEEAQYEKERGNTFVQLKKWDEAISCYTRAIELNATDATYFANRALCYLKKEDLLAAEADCSLALNLDPTYIKAFLRRSSARLGLGSLRNAASDLIDVLRLEPNNESVKRQLATVNERIGKNELKTKLPPSLVNNSKLDSKQTVDMLELIVNECVDLNVLQAIEKPPHLRSQKPMLKVKIIQVLREVEFYKSAKKHTDRMSMLVKRFISIDNFEPNNKRMSYNEYTLLKSKEKKFKKKCSNKKDDIVKKSSKDTSLIDKQNIVNTKNTVVKNKIINTVISPEIKIENSENPNSFLPIPKSSMQFVSDWRLLKGNDTKLSKYLKSILPMNIPVIFKESLESDLLSEILHIILNGVDFNDNNSSVLSLPYMQSLTNVKRFSALSMFLSDNDKDVISKILQRCKDQENASEEDINLLKNKFEL